MKLGRVKMRNLVRAVAMAVLLAAASLGSKPAQAMAIMAPAGLKAAAEQINLTETSSIGSTIARITGPVITAIHDRITGLTVTAMRGRIIHTTTAIMIIRTTAPTATTAPITGRTGTQRSPRTVRATAISGAATSTTPPTSGTDELTNRREAG